MAFPTSIRGQQDMILWEKSEAYADLMGMITSIASVIKGKSLKTEYNISEVSTPNRTVSLGVSNIPVISNRPIAVYMSAGKDGCRRMKIQ